MIVDEPNTMIVPDTKRSPSISVGPGGLPFPIPAMTGGIITGPPQIINPSNLEMDGECGL